MTERRWYHVEGIVCAACVGIIESIVTALPGVESASVSYVGQSLCVEGEPEADIGQALKRRGYTAVAIDEKEALKADYGGMGKLRQRIVISFFLSLCLSLGRIFSWNPWLMLAAATAVQIVAGRHFYKDAYRAASGGGVNMSVLVSIGALSAYIYSAVSLISGGTEMFFEVSGSVLTLIMMGKYLERSASISASASVRAMMEAGAREAVLLTDDGEMTVSADKIRLGDRFIVRKGDFIPADGIVISGQGEADESTLTGESRPVTKAVGDRVYAASINTGSRLTVEACCDYEDSVYMGMLRALMSGISGEKPRIQRLADRVCARFVPAVLIFALLTLMGWYGFFAPGDFSLALRRAVAVLIVACPCAMGIATPLAVTVSIGFLGKSGIFVKEPAALETLARTDVLVFDKTGTLTVGSEDRLRKGTVKTMETLKRMGIRVIMLSGDNEIRAAAAAKAAGIDEYRSALLPEDKAAYIDRLREEHTVTMVGDGVNDALSLTRADVGIAIGSAVGEGSVSAESASVVITKNRIAHVLKAIYAGRVMLKNIKYSLFWALIYNILGLIFAACGLLSPLMAGAAMSLSSFSVVMNARALEKRFTKLSFDIIAGN